MAFWDVILITDRKFNDEMFYFQCKKFINEVKVNQINKVASTWLKIITLKDIELMNIHTYMEWSYISISSISITSSVFNYYNFTSTISSSTFDNDNFWLLLNNDNLTSAISSTVSVVLNNNNFWLLLNNNNGWTSTVSIVLNNDDSTIWLVDDFFITLYAATHFYNVFSFKIYINK